VHTGYLWVNLKPISHLIKRGVVGRIIKHGSSGSGIVEWDRIDRAQDRDRSRDLVNTVMNFQVS
jgi:hypothetical protein